MFFVDQLILISALLTLAGILSSNLSPRIGVPVLVLFLAVGLLAGEDGPGNIAFDNASAAHTMGTFALALILFDGGLQTSLRSIKAVWKPASVLATYGVVGTAVITGAIASLILPLSIVEGLLLGAIVGSTDAAAVFSVLRNAGIQINQRLRSTLEIESASNDPMAIFLTISLLTYIQNPEVSGWQMVGLFISQMGVGAAVGLLIGWVVNRALAKLKLMTAGLYPVFVAMCGLLSFGLAANLNGSGFLAIFITGVMIGNKPFTYQRNTFLFMDGLAWLAQISMFVVLGLLVNPSELMSVWWQSLLIAAVLVVIARPLAVAPVVALFGFNRRETALISWVGLRGSVPIILAIFPLLYGLDHAEIIFDVVFFVVLLSATVQGTSLPFAARRLKLIEETSSGVASATEIANIGEVNADIVEFELFEHSPSVGKLIQQLGLPDDTVVAMINRDSVPLVAKGTSVLKAGDKVFVIVSSANADKVETILSGEQR